MKSFAVSRDLSPILEDTSRAKMISSPLLPTASLAEEEKKNKTKQKNVIQGTKSTASDLGLHCLPRTLLDMQIAY